LILRAVEIAPLLCRNFDSILVARSLCVHNVPLCPLCMPSASTLANIGGTKSVRADAACESTFVAGQLATLKGSLLTMTTERDAAVTASEMMASERNAAVTACNEAEVASETMANERNDAVTVSEAMTTTRNEAVAVSKKTGLCCNDIAPSCRNC
jgi:hypothetical protein